MELSPVLENKFKEYKDLSKAFDEGKNKFNQFEKLNEFKKFIDDLNPFITSNEIKYPVIEMDIPEEKIDHAFDQLKCCIIPRILDFWREVLDKNDFYFYFHSSFIGYLNAILLDLEKFKLADFVHKKFFISHLFCFTKKLIDYDLRRNDFREIFSELPCYRFFYRNPDIDQEEFFNKNEVLF